MVRKMDEVENKYLPDNARFRPRRNREIQNKFLLHYFYEQQRQIHSARQNRFFQLYDPRVQTVWMKSESMRMWRLEVRLLIKVRMLNMMVKKSLQLKFLMLRKYIKQGKRVPLGLRQAQEQIDKDRAEYEVKPLKPDPWFPFEMPIFTDTETSKMGMIYIADRQIRVATHMGRIPPWFDPDDPEKEARVKEACRATKERHGDYMSLYKDYPEELPPVPSNPFILDPDLKKCLTEDEYEDWQKSYLKRYPRKCDIWEGWLEGRHCQIFGDLLFPELPEDPMHDLPEEVWDPEKRKASGRGTFNWWLVYHTEQLGFHTFVDTIEKSYKKEFSKVDDEFIREECETNWDKLPKHLKRHYEFLGLNLTEYSMRPPNHGTMNPFPSTKKHWYYPLDGDEPEWRPYIPQHIGITQYEERLFRLGAYSQYNVWNENADLIHEFLFFGGNWPKHDDLDLMAQEINDPEFNELVKNSKKRAKLEAAGADLFSFPRNLDEHRPITSAWGTDSETGELFMYNPMFEGVPVQKRCHDRKKVPDGLNQDDLKFKKWTESEDRKLKVLATAKAAAQKAKGHNQAGMTWKEIAKEVTKEQGYQKGYERTDQACKGRWSAIKDGSYFIVADIKTWEPWERKRLVDKCRKMQQNGGKIKWDIVARSLVGRTKGACRMKWKALNGRIKRKESKYVGPTWEPAEQKWKVQIRDGKRNINLGFCANEKEAALMYDKKCRELRGDKAKLNIPREGEKQAKKPHKWTEFEVEELFRMKDEGMKNKEIAKELGFTVGSVAKKLQQSTRHKVKDAHLVKCWLPHDVSR